MKYKINFLGRYHGAQGEFSEITTVERARDEADARNAMFQQDTFEVQRVLAVTIPFTPIPVKSIEITSGEGRMEWYPKTVYSFDHFEHWASGIRHNIMRENRNNWPGGYYKMDFVVTFEDDYTYRGRYDLSEESRGDTLQGHIWTHNRFMAGVYRPRHLALAHYLSFLKDDCRVDSKVHLDFLLRYDI